MAMRFDQIGSQQNVQNVGEGEAYVYEKQKSPLLALGEQAMKTKLAEDKAKAKAAAAQTKADQATMLTSENAGNLFNEVHQDYFNNNVATYTAKGGDFASQQEAAKKNAIVKTSALAHKDLNAEINRVDSEANKAYQRGDLDIDLYNKLKNEQLSEAKKAYINASNPDEGLLAFNRITSQINPTDIMAKSSRISEKDIKDLGNEVSKELKTTFANTSIGSGGVVTTKDSQIVTKELDNLVDATWKKPIVYQTYAKHNFDKSLDSEGLSAFNGYIDNKNIPKDKDDYIFKDTNGVEHRISRNAWGKDEYKKHILTYTDKNISKSYQASWTPQGGVSIKGTNLTPGTYSYVIGNATKNKNLDYQLPGDTFTADKPVNQTSTVKGTGFGLVVNQPKDTKVHGSISISPGETLYKNGINYTLTNERGESQLYDNIIVFDKNGDIDVNATAGNIKDKQSKGYKFGNKIGGFVSVTKLDKDDAQLISQSENLSKEDQAKAAETAINSSMTKDLKSQIMIPITGKDANLGRSLFSEIVGYTDFNRYVSSSSNKNGKLLQKALDLGLKTSTKTTGGGTGGQKTKRIYAGLDKDGNPIYKEVK